MKYARGGPAAFNNDFPQFCFRLDLSSVGNGAKTNQFVGENVTKFCEVMRGMANLFPVAVAKKDWHAIE